MNHFAKSAAVLLFTVLAFMSSFAAQTTFNISEDTTLAGQPLKPGEYKLEYTINGSNADLQLKQGHKVVATARGQVVELDRASMQSAYVRNTTSDGSSAITEFRFSGQKQAIHVASDSGDKAGR